jgi:hypothetical protein
LAEPSRVDLPRIIRNLARAKGQRLSD